MATPLETITAYIAEIRQYSDNQQAQIAAAEQAKQAATQAKLIFDSQIGALEEVARRIQTV